MQWKDATDKSADAIAKEMQTSLDGLTVDEVMRRREEYGANQIEEHSVRWWHTLLRQFQSSFIYLLLVAAGLSFLLGERTEAEMMLLFLLINTLFGFFQEHHSIKTLDLLKKYLVSRSRVMRGNEEVSIESRDIVPGDVLMLAAGDKIAADVYFIESHDVMVDEEILTGESVAVEKIGGALKERTEQMYQAKNIGFAGTVLMRGRGVGVVIATGGDTAMGEVAHLTETTNRESTFEKGILRFSRFIMRLVIVTLTLIFLVNLLIKGEGANPMELLIFSLVLVISVIPEALPFVITVSLSRGSLRLAKKKVVVKRLSAIEDLGSVEVLCSDKTGTLTENKLTMEKVYADSKKQCLYAAVLASDYAGLEKGEDVDPFDEALWNAIDAKEREALLACTKISEAPFDPVRRRNSAVIWDQEERWLIVRGAPEAIIEISTHLSFEQKAKYLRWMAMQGEDGRRVLAVSHKPLPGKAQFSLERDESDLEFLGLISFVDPIKETAQEAINEARRLGIEVKIITGDSKEVSGSVATRIGLIASPHEVILGEELEALAHTKKLEMVRKYSVFARVSPQQKYMIIELLQETKEVGFLGEGINDAPALKLANVALVVQSASDIARSAADVVLLDTSLKVIIDGIREGRSIFANIIKYIKTTLTSNFGNFYSVAIASLLIPFVPMLPLQILLIDILSDFPMIALATDAVDTEELQKPKGYNVRDVVLSATILGVVSSMFDFILFATFYQKGEGVLQTNWFMLSLFTELVLIFSLRSRRPFWKAKRPSTILVMLSLAMLTIGVTVPFTQFGQRVFHFAQPTHSSVVWILSLVGVYFFATEVVKRLYCRITEG
ncbi:MAG: HAD-IC family P-type ATPase [Candidatus Moranbacteria bacterium]|nr:HAD-IC family P-type ATPase [Candidatus Moranbacteria bacterium]